MLPVAWEQQVQQNHMPPLGQRPAEACHIASQRPLRLRLLPGILRRSAPWQDRLLPREIGTRSLPACCLSVMLLSALSELLCN